MLDSRKYFKILLYLYVFIGFSFSYGQVFKPSAYDDFFRAVKQDDGRAVAALIAQGFDANTPYGNGDYALVMAIHEQSASVVADCS
jgi:hypothetical protein